MTKPSRANAEGNIIGPLPKKALQEMTPYVPQFGASADDNPIRLSANESGIGPSPKVIEALAAYLPALNRYPKPQDQALNTAIAARYQVNPEMILSANGSDELIYLLCQTYLDSGDEAIYTQYGFLVFAHSIRLCGAVAVQAADDNYTASVDAILASVTGKTKLVFLANPNNPTGTMIAESEVRRLHAALPAHVILVLDWAYAEYQEAALAYAAGMVEQNSNIVMLRTFSKMHGLAGLRLGWGYMPADIIGLLGSVRGPFSVNAIAALAGRIGVADRDWQARVLSVNANCLNQLSQRLDALGLDFVPGMANFLLVHFDATKGPDAAFVARALAALNILVRDMRPYGLPNSLRISTGTEAQMDALHDALRSILAHKTG